MKKYGAIAILCLWRTGSQLLRDVLMACGMHDYGDEIGFDHGDINGTGNSLFHGIPVDNPSEIVVNALKYFTKVAKSKEWKHYGVKVDHVLQTACWEDVGKTFLSEWPDARYVISLRHPAGVIQSFEKIKRLTPERHPGFTVQDIIETYLGTYEATKYLIEKKDALVVVYPDSLADGSIKKVVGELGLKWTKKAGELFDQSTLGDFLPLLGSDEGLIQSPEVLLYLKAVDMFEEFKECAVKRGTSSVKLDTSKRIREPDDIFHG